MRMCSILSILSILAAIYTTANEIFFYVLYLKIERLTEERDEHSKNLLAEAKSYEKELSEQEIVTEEEVIAVMKDKYRSEEKEKEDIKSKRQYKC